MNTEESNIPWLECDEWQGDDGLLGNRQGFELLRERIDQLLSGTEDPVLLDAEASSLRVLKLCTSPPQSVPTTLGTRIFFCCLAAFVGFSLLLGLGTIIAVISLLFS